MQTVRALVTQPFVLSILREWHRETICFLRGGTEKRESGWNISLLFFFPLSLYRKTRGPNERTRRGERPAEKEGKLRGLSNTLDATVEGERERVSISPSEKIQANNHGAIRGRTQVRIIPNLAGL